MHFKKRREGGFDLNHSLTVLKSASNGLTCMEWQFWKKENGAEKKCEETKAQYFPIYHERLQHTNPRNNKSQNLTFNKKAEIV
jgi:hypothetical protein